MSQISENKIEEINNQVEWNLLFYICDDNRNMISPFDYALSQLSKFSSTNINLCILKRSSTHYGSYKITIKNGNIVSKQISELGYITGNRYGDIDMLDPYVLYNFVKDGLMSCSSKNTALFIQCHSNSWYLKQDINETRIRTYAEFFHPLLIDKIHFDIICITSCFVATIELAYEIRNLANYMIAHEISSPLLPFWSSTTMSVFSNKELTSKDICFQIIEDYIFNLNKKGIDEQEEKMKVATDISVIDLTQFDSFVNYLSTLNLENISTLGLEISKPDPDNYNKQPTIYMAHDLYTAVKYGLNLSQQDFNFFESFFDRVVIKYIQSKKLKKENWSNILHGISYIPCPWKHEKNGYTYKSLEFYKLSDKFINCEIYF